MLTVLIDRGAAFGPDVVVGDDDRARWRAQLPGVRAGERCGCGTCPSIVLTDEAGTPSRQPDDRAVLEGWTEDALILLFVEGDRLSHLELAPLGEAVVAAFPDPADVRTA